MERMKILKFLSWKGGTSIRKESNENQSLDIFLISQIQKETKKKLMKPQNTIEGSSG